ncbi:hypothetical protein [Streptomyces sp. LaPpAH-108]|uniref:hypothetical protein n=1 Tax=Streptomyces sp. LaPpAH-108 TaxID=1155714 RepID=UPI001319F40C|nr:hypothetical protein [Streptomyces sp. LaPpAH-108]
MRRRATVTLAAVAASLTLVAPASPAPQDDGGLRIEVPEVYYTQTTDPTRVALPVRFDTGGGSVREVALTVDASEVRGTVRLYAKRSCAEGTGYVFTCRVGAGQLRSGLMDLMVLGADRSAAPGTRGTVRFTATAPDGGQAHAKTEMTAGSPELWGRKLSVENAPADTPVEIRGGVLNHGPIAANGFGVTVTADPRIRLAHRYGNCRYTDQGQSRAYCFFPSRVEPGQAYAFTGPFLALGGKPLTKGSVDVRLFAPGQDAGPYFDERDFTVRGSGPALALTPTAPEGFARSAGHVSIDTDQKADVQAVAGDLRGRPGDVVGIEAGVRNAGPGRVDHGYLTYEITPPEGTTLLPPPKPTPDPEGDGEPDPWVCRPWRAGAGHYTCVVSGSLAPGAKATQTLRFRIGRDDSGAPGRVSAVLRDDYDRRDPDRSDNTAPITVNGSASATGALWPVLAACGTAAAVLALAAAVPYGLRRARRRRNPPPTAPADSSAARKP